VVAVEEEAAIAAVVVAAVADIKRF
jgi:hypothetical protein